MKKKTIITVLLTIIALILVRKGVSFVYDKIEVMNAPTMQEIVEANPWTVPTDWFKTDTITIKGRIEDYDAEQFGFTSMACYYNDVFEKGSNFLLVWQTIHVAFDITLLAIAGTAIAIIIWT